MTLCVEKLAQHTVITWAFFADLGDLREEVAVDYRWLAATGAVIGLLFLVAFVALVARQRWSLTLLSGLAGVDIVGEFIAQGTVVITLTVSFVVALVILILARMVAHTTATGQHD